MVAGDRALVFEDDRRVARHGNESVECGLVRRWQGIARGSARLQTTRSHQGHGTGESNER